MVVAQAAMLALAEAVDSALAATAAAAAAALPAPALAALVVLAVGAELVEAATMLAMAMAEERAKQAHCRVRPTAAPLPPKPHLPGK